MPSEPEHLAIRLARIRRLLEELEDVCSQSAEHRQLRLKLKQETDAAAPVLKTADRKL